MIFKKQIVIILVVFLATAFYLHQKVGIYVEAYKLSGNYQINSELISKRDCMANIFYKKVTVARLNQWAKDNKFTALNKERVLALNFNRNKQGDPRVKLAALFNRVVGISSVSAKSNVRAQER